MNGHILEPFEQRFN